MQIPRLRACGASLGMTRVVTRCGASLVKGRYFPFFDESRSISLIAHVESLVAVRDTPSV